MRVSLPQAVPAEWGLSDCYAGLLPGSSCAVFGIYNIFSIIYLYRGENDRLEQLFLSFNVVTFSVAPMRVACNAHTWLPILYSLHMTCATAYF